MEMYQAGFYTEDFRTQEVPGGFDFSSYGKILIQHIFLHTAFKYLLKSPVISLNT